MLQFLQIAFLVLEDFYNLLFTIKLNKIFESPQYYYCGLFLMVYFILASSYNVMG